MRVLSVHCCADGSEGKESLGEFYCTLAYIATVYWLIAFLPLSGVGKVGLWLLEDDQSSLYLSSSSSSTISLSS